jgi:hypothetical protein
MLNWILDHPLTGALVLVAVYITVVTLIICF